MLAKIIDLLRYPSTYQGLVILLGLVGVALNPEQTAAITAGGAALVGLLKVFLSDSNVEKK